MLEVDEIDNGGSGRNRAAPLRKHSRTGCITCKVRKKRCSEDKPICSDCRRLNFTCVYLPRSTDKRVLSKYKSQIERELFAQKSSRKKVTQEIRPAVVEVAETLEVDEYSPLDQQHVQYREEDVGGTVALMGSGLDLELEDEFAALDPFLSQPLSDPICIQLDSMGIHLYNYYRSHLAQIISIAPTRQNYYLQVFLPMAHQHSGILYGLMAWSAHHLSINLDSDDSQQNYRDENYLELAYKYTLESLQRLRSEQADSDSFLWSLAQVLILCAAEICQGDVNKWKVLLKYGGELIEQNVGKDISKLLSCRMLASKLPSLDATTRYWLVANFIYHDIMCSQGTFFPTDQYKRVLNQQDTAESSEQDGRVQSVFETDYSNDAGKLHLDPLHGINRPILLYLGDITNLTRKMKQGPLRFNKDHPKFKEYMKIALQLETNLHQIVPNVMYLKLYEESARDYALCLELFRLMQIAALIHLKTTCLKYSKYCIEIQYLWSLLSDKLLVTLGSKVEGSLCFPMFIYGINCIDQDQRDEVERRFDDIMKRYKCYNFQRARIIMRKVWKQDQDDASSARSSVSSGSSGNEGLTFDLNNKDWYDIVDELGWDISFA